jgi:hypothetical protein
MKSAMRVQAACCASLYRPVQPGVNADHLGEHQSGATGRAATKMHQMPVGRHAVDRRVLIHRRDDHTIGDRHAAQPEWLKHRHGRRFDIGLEPLAAHIARHDLVDLGDEFRRAQSQIVIGDGLGARHQPEGKARRLHVPEAPHVLEPDQRDVRGMLGLLHFKAPLGLVMRKRLFYLPCAGRPECIEQRDRVFHRKLGAGADGEMRGRLGVADQHNVVVGPAFAADGREAAP